MDPQIYTREDRYHDMISHKMPDLSKVQAAAKNFVLAIAELGKNDLVKDIERPSQIAAMVYDLVGECLTFDEHEDFALTIRDLFTEEMNDGRIAEFGHTVWELERKAQAAMKQAA